MLMNDRRNLISFHNFSCDTFWDFEVLHFIPVKAFIVYPFYDRGKSTVI